MVGHDFFVACCAPPPGRTRITHSLCGRNVLQLVRFSPWLRNHLHMQLCFRWLLCSWKWSLHPIFMRSSALGIGGPAVTRFPSKGPNTRSTPIALASPYLFLQGTYQPSTGQTSCLSCQTVRNNLAALNPPPHTLTQPNLTTIPLFLQGRYQQSTGQTTCLTCTAVRLSPSDAPRFVVCAALTATSNPNPKTPGQVQSEHRQHIYQCLPELRGGAYLLICTSCVASLAAPLTTALQPSPCPPPPQGTYNPSLGSTAVSACLSCAAVRFPSFSLLCPFVFLARTLLPPDNALTNSPPYACSLRF